MNKKNFWVEVILLGCILIKDAAADNDPCASGSLNEGQLFLLEEGCVPFYYECVHGKSLQRPCAPGTVFDEDVGVCNHPSEVKACENLDHEKDPCGDGTYPEGKLFLFEDGCFPFYFQCVHGEAIKRPCASGTVFDSTIENCNHPRDVAECADKSDCNGHAHGDLYTEGVGCYSYFYQCTHGTAVKQDCPVGLVFDTSLNVCNWPSNVPGCSGNEEEKTSIQIVTTLRPAHDTNGCDGHSHGDLYVPEGCHSFFYQCVHGKAYKMPCPEGLVFDPSLNVCNWPSDVAGCNTEGGCNGHSHGDVYVDDESGCYPFFYQCVHDEAVQKNCAEGLVFDPAISVCNWPASVSGCSTENGCHGHSHGDLYLPEEGCFPYFYQCVHGKAYKMPCPDGLVFDTSLDVCNWPSQVEGCQGGALPATSMPTSTRVVAKKTTVKPTQPSTTTTSTKVVTESTTAKVTRPPRGKTYVGFIVDDTGSMSKEIGAVKDWLVDCIRGSNFVCAEEPTGGWIVSSFNDPEAKLEVGPTNDVNQSIAAVHGLRAHGGWDCPEMALAGMIKALEAVPDENDGCKMFFFSDAAAKDLHRASEVFKLFLKKRCIFIPILTSCCGKCHWPCLFIDSEYCINHVVEKAHTLRRKRETENDITPESFYYALSVETGGNIYITEKPKSVRSLKVFLEKSVTMGFCGSSELAGPEGKPYLCKSDCTVKGMCWDSGVNKCYCTSTQCVKEAIEDGLSLCGQETPKFFCDWKVPQDHFADPKRCDSFFTCKFGKLSHFTCPEGKLYSPLTSDHCDYPGRVPGPCKSL